MMFLRFKYLINFEIGQFQTTELNKIEQLQMELKIHLEQFEKLTFSL